MPINHYSNIEKGSLDKLAVQWLLEPLLGRWGVASFSAAVVAITHELSMSLDALVGMEPPVKRQRPRKAAPVA